MECGCQARIVRLLHVVYDAGAWFADSRGGAARPVDPRSRVVPIQATLDKVARAGGTVIVPETEIPGGGGRFAQFIDPEGHVLGIYAEP